MEKYSIKAIIICSLIFLLNLFDTISIHLLISLGLVKEANPLMNFLIAHYGFISFYFVKIIIGLLVFILFIKYWKDRFCKIGSYVLLLIYSLVVIHHIIGWIYVT